MRPVVLILLFLLNNAMNAQTLGGRTAYPFLKLPASPLLGAAGGVNTSWKPGDAGLAAYQPAALTPDLHGQLHLAFNNLPAGLKAYHLAGARYLTGPDVVLGGAVLYMDYGSIPATDAAGNEQGAFRPQDYTVQLSAARAYADRWRYGVTLKWIHSAYQLYRSSALALDVGLTYADSSRRLVAGLLARNMGAQLRSYAGVQEDLPFDLQLGITHRLANAPLGFSLTAQQLHRFPLGYNDTLFNRVNNLADRSTADRLFNHFVVAAHLYAGQQLEATLGYNHLRRTELGQGAAARGSAGFSYGLRARFRRLQFSAAHSTYLPGSAYFQFGATVNLNEW